MLTEIWEIFLHLLGQESEFRSLLIFGLFLIRRFIFHGLAIITARARARVFGLQAPRLEVIKTSEPSGRKSGVKVKTVAELVDKLKNEAGVI